MQYWTVFFINVNFIQNFIESSVSNGQFLIKNPTLWYTLYSYHLLNELVW
jgi:hypothetical protein